MKIIPLLMHCVQVCWKMCFFQCKVLSVVVVVVGGDDGAPVQMVVVGREEEVVQKVGKG